MNEIRGVASFLLRSPHNRANLFHTPVLFSTSAYKISGVTRDSLGNALGNCTVQLFYTATNILAAQTQSDASGNYAFSIGPSQACYIVAYLPGSPDVAGTTVNTLVAA